MTKRFLSALATGGLALATFAADYEYVPTGEAPYYWDMLGNWVVGTAPNTVPASSLPTSADGVSVLNANLNTLTPLIIPEGCSAEASEFILSKNPTATMCVSNAGTLSVSGNFYVGYYGQGTNVFENFGTTKVSGQLYVARSSNSHYNPCVSFMNIHEGSWLLLNGDQTIVAVGGDGIGEMHVRGDVICETRKDFYVGYNRCSSTILDHTIGLLEVSGDGLITTNASQKTGNILIRAGHYEDSVGTVRIVDNGVIRYRPPSGSGAGAIFGEAARSTAYLTMSNNAVFYLTTNAGIDFSSGVDSSGFLTMADNALCSSPTTVNMASGARSDIEAGLSGSAVFNVGGDLNVASGGASTAKIRIAENAELRSVKDMTFAQGTGSRAEVVLEGGKLSIRPDAPNNVLRLGADASSARISGYGKLGTQVWSPSLANSRYLHLELAGQVVADGKGSSQTLDMGLYMEVNSETYARTGHGNVCGSNGWYAVNGGRLVMPQYQSVTNGSWCVGDFSMSVAPSFAGSFKVDFAAQPAESYLHASLYAADHSDVPAGLPTEDKNLCVEDIWRLGYGAGDKESDPTSVVDFGSADITFRFGARSVKPGKTYTVAAWRYDVATSQWVKVSSAEYAPANPTIVFRNVTPVNGGATKWNMGWFAVTLEKNPGTLILLR